MKTISIAMLAALALAGCKKGAEPKAEGSSCAGVAATMMKLQGPELFGQLPDDKQAKWRDRFTETFTAACTEDGWSEQARACLAAAGDGSAIDACVTQLTQAQKDQVQKRVQPMMTAIMEDMGVVMPPPADLSGAPAVPGAAAPAAAAPPGDTAAPDAAAAGAPAAETAPAPPK
jgi:hypothetical protein